MEYIPLWERDSHEEGVKIGVKEGAKDKAIEMAKMMKMEGEPVEKTGTFHPLRKAGSKEQGKTGHGTPCLAPKSP